MSNHSLTWTRDTRPAQTAGDYQVEVTQQVRAASHRQTFVVSIRFGCCPLLFIILLQAGILPGHFTGQGFLQKKHAGLERQEGDERC